MGVSTKGEKYKGAKAKAPKLVMNDGGGVTKPVNEMSYSERVDYIDEKYIPHIKSAQTTFMITESGFDYDLNDRSEKDRILSHYADVSDYTEKTLEQHTDYAISDGWNMVRRFKDPETGEVEEYDLEELSGDNTYNFFYLGMIDLNWRVYYDEETDNYFYVIHPHMGGDIRGNYGEAFILEGDDKEELFYRFFGDFISGLAMVTIEFKDGSTVSFDSQQYSDVFYFEYNDFNEEELSPIAQEFVDDFDSFGDWNGDSFLEETVDRLKVETAQPEKKMSGGGGVYDLSPKIYVQILGYSDGKWMDISDMSDGSEVIDAIEEYMEELNEADGGNREEYRIADMEGFMHKTFWDEYMSESDFDEVLNAWQVFEGTDFPEDVVEEYYNDQRFDDVEEAIRSMEESFHGKYDDKADFAYWMVEEGVYTPSQNDYTISHTDQHLLADELATSDLEGLDFRERLDLADLTSEFDNEQSDLEEDYDDLQEQSELLEDALDDLDGDEYDRVSEELSEVESKMIDLREQIDNLEEEWSSRAYDGAHDERYNDYLYRIENDMDDLLAELGIEPSQANFLSVDYESVGDELAMDYNIYEYGGDYYFFRSYEGGGAVKKIGKPKDYKFYVVEMKSNKVVSGHPTKAEANERKKELSKKHRRTRFSVYDRPKVEAELGIDTTTYSDFTTEDTFKYGGNVNLRSPKRHEVSKENWRTADKLRSAMSDLKKSAKGATKEAKEDLKKDFDVAKAEYSKLRAKNYKDTKSFFLGGAIRKGAHGAKRGAKKGASWLQKQWEEADFGDGTGKAEFDDGGYIPEEVKTMSDTQVLSEVNQRYHFEGENHDYEPINDPELARELLAIENTGSYAEGGEVGVGKEVLFLDRRGQEQVGMITDDLGDGEFAILYGKGFKTRQSLVDSDNIIGIAPKKRRGIFRFIKGGQPSNLVWYKGSQLGRIKRVVKKKDGKEIYILETPDTGKRIWGRFKGEKLRVAEDGMEVQDEQIQDALKNAEIRKRRDIKSDVFYVSNSYDDRVELKPYSNESIDKIYVYSNSVVFYKNGTPIDELRNIYTDSNFELAKDIEDRLSTYSNGGSTDNKWIQDAVKNMEKKGTVGAFTRQANRHGMTPVEFAKEVLNNPEKYTERTRERAQFVKNTNPDKF